MKPAIVLSLMMALLCGAASARALSSGAPAPEFRAMDASGHMRSLSEFKGKIVVLNFWATWCPLCVNELAVLDRVQQRYQNSGVVVLAAATDAQGWSTVGRFLAGRRVSYPVVIANAHTCQLYGGVEALPQTFFLNRDGMVVASVNSALSEDSFDRVLQLLR